MTNLDSYERINVVFMAKWQKSETGTDSDYYTIQDITIQYPYIRKKNIPMTKGEIMNRIDVGFTLTMNNIPKTDGNDNIEIKYDYDDKRYTMTATIIVNKGAVLNRSIMEYYRYVVLYVGIYGDMIDGAYHALVEDENGEPVATYSPLVREDVYNKYPKAFRDNLDLIADEVAEFPQVSEINDDENIIWNAHYFEDVMAPVLVRDTITNAFDAAVKSAGLLDSTIKPPDEMLKAISDYLMNKHTIAMVYMRLSTGKYAMCLASTQYDSALPIGIVTRTIDMSIPLAYIAEAPWAIGNRSLNTI